MSIQGKTIVFTGRISKPRHEFQRLVEENGGIAGSDVSRSTDYLIVGDTPGTKLVRASMLGIKTITEEEFMQLLKEPEAQTPESEEFVDYCHSGSPTHHFWFRTTEKENGDIVKDCLCGTILIQHPNGKWEKHEPKHVIEQAKKVAHQHAVQEERRYYEGLRKRGENEKIVLRQLEQLSSEDLQQLERQLER